MAAAAGRNRAAPLPSCDGRSDLNLRDACQIDEMTSGGIGDFLNPGHLNLVDVAATIALVSKT